MKDAKERLFDGIIVKFSVSIEISLANNKATPPLAKTSNIVGKLQG